MASADPEVAESKKDKKEKKQKDKKDKKRSESDGVHKEKRDKKKEKSDKDKLAQALDAHLQAEVASKESAAVAADEAKRRRKEERELKKKGKRDAAEEGDDDEAEGKEAPEGALVYFAYPMADDKTHKKLFKLIKKGAKLRAISRGVKECEKAIKKSALRQLNVESAAHVPALLVIAGDISPPEVIEHFPLHCEEHNVPYVFVKSRAALGVAACTKRATSVVLVRPEGKGPAAGSGKKNADADEDKDGGKVDPEEFREAWSELVRLAQKQYVAQVMPFIQREKRGY